MELKAEIEDEAQSDAQSDVVSTNLMTSLPFPERTGLPKSMRGVASRR